MKRSTKAGLLSFIIPGAGLWYCGRPMLAVVNFLIALACPLVGFYALLLGEHVLWIILGIAAGSAGYAHAVASRALLPP